MYAIRGKSHKIHINITLDPELLRKLKEELEVKNLSALIDLLLMNYVKEKTAPVHYECPCGVVTGRPRWNKWANICPNCGRNHGIKDERRVVPEGAA